MLCVHVCVCSVTKSCPTLCDPMDCCLPGCSVRGISQARMMEGVAISFFRGSSWPKDWTHVSCLGGWILYHWATLLLLSCVRLCCPMNFSMPRFSVHHCFLGFAQTHVHWVSDAMQPSRALRSPSSLALSLSQHQGLFQWVSSSHQVARVLLELQL